VSDKSEDFLSFEKALRELKMRSEELKKLVSEGEIRAFRDGDSMKFRAEDVQALAAKAEGEQQLSFADSLEDDTGMATEQISEEDTLLAEDQEPEVEQRTPRQKAASTRTGRGVAVAAAAPDKEPGWVTAVAILSAVVMIWGMMICFSAATEQDPKASMFTSAFAKK
jgi:predicted metal-dependent hydrolase